MRLLHLAAHLSIFGVLAGLSQRLVKLAHIVEWLIHDYASLEPFNMRLWVSCDLMEVVKGLISEMRLIMKILMRRGPNYRLVRCHYLRRRLFRMGKVRLESRHLDCRVSSLMGKALQLDTSSSMLFGRIICFL